MELSQCGAGGLLKARATMRCLTPQATEVTEAQRSTVLVVAVAVGALVTLVLLPLPGRGIQYTGGGLGAGASAYILGITVRLYGYVTTTVGWRSVFTDCVSASRGLSCIPPGD